MLITQKRKQLKLEKLKPIYQYIRESDGKVRINDFWNSVTRETLKKSWNTRAYFLQDFKKFVPDDIKVIMAQKSGTFAIRRIKDGTVKE